MNLYVGIGVPIYIQDERGLEKAGVPVATLPSRGTDGLPTQSFLTAKPALLTLLTGSSNA